MITKLDKNADRQKRHERVRKNLSGTPERPRLNVYRSLSHIYVQIIDDIAGHTLVSSSTVDKAIAKQLAGKTKKEAARIVGEAAGKKAIDAGIKAVVFDRGGYIYTGRVKEVAEGARSAGLNF